MQSKTKLHYQHFEIPNIDAAPQQVGIQQHELTVPTEPNKKVIPIPSKQILPNDDYKDYIKKKQLQYSQSGSLIINSHNLKLLCIKEGLYQFPELNTKLYLHFKSIEKIQNLSQYYNLRTLYLQNNVIRKIQNLQCLPNLENLFLQHNMIDKIQGLNQNKKLIVLNLSYNNIFAIQGLSDLTHLQNLMITDNHLEKFESVAHLGQCSATLSSIDLSNNRISADPRLFDLVTQVKCLYLSGNPLVREMEHYRRTVIGRLKNLLYLDQRAVGEDERLLAEKWIQEGNQGMKKVKAELQLKKMERRKQQKKELMKDINSHRNKKVNIFRKSISQLESQIQKFKQYRDDPSNQEMYYYYDSHIQEKQSKIRELEGFIQNINCRIEGRQPPKREQIKTDEVNLLQIRNQPQNNHISLQQKTQNPLTIDKQPNNQKPPINISQLDTDKNNKQNEAQNTGTRQLVQIIETQSDKGTQAENSQQNNKQIGRKTQYSYDELD